MKWCNILMDGETERATVGATDGLIEIESTHYLLHHDHEVTRRSLINCSSEMVAF